MKAYFIFELKVHKLVSERQKTLAQKKPSKSASKKGVEGGDTEFMSFG